MNALVKCADVVLPPSCVFMQRIPHPCCDCPLSEADARGGQAIHPSPGVKLECGVRRLERRTLGVQS